MSWAIGFDEKWQRDVGYGVPAMCDHPGCGARIDRGLSHVCGGEPFGGDEGCGLYFCDKHLSYDDNGVPLCERCRAKREPFDPTPDVKKWFRWKLTDKSWSAWRAVNPKAVKHMKAALKAVGK